MKLRRRPGWPLLAWVWPALADTFAAAGRALHAPGEAMTAAPPPPCADHLRLARGVLWMIQQDAPARLAEEMLAVAEALAGTVLAEPEQARAALNRALIHLPDYLRGLVVDDREHAPMSLLPLLNELRTSRGESVLSPSAWFFPPLDAPLPDYVPGARDGTSEEQGRAAVTALRARFQQPLLGWLRDQESSLQLTAMRELLEAIGTQCAGLAGRRLWWIAASVLEGVELGALQARIAEVRRLAGKVDRSIHHWLESGEQSLAEADATELARQLLYLVAQARPETPRLRQLRQIYRLDDWLPDPAGPRRTPLAAGASPGPDAPSGAIQAAKQDLLRAKNALEPLYQRGMAEPASLDDALQAFSGLGAALDRLGLPREGLDEQRRVFEKIAARSRDPEPAALLDAATVLLRIEAELDSPTESPRPPVDRDAGAKAPLAGPRGEEARVIAAIMRESAIDAAAAEDVLAAFAGSAGDPARLERLPMLMRRLAGAMRMVSAPRPAALAVAIGRCVETALRDAGADLPGEFIERLADGLVALSTYTELARDYHHGFERALEVGEQSLAQLGYVAMDRRSDGGGDSGQTAVWPAPTVLAAADGVGADGRESADGAPEWRDPSLSEPRDEAGAALRQDRSNGGRSSEEGDAGLDAELRAIFLQESHAALECLRAALLAWLAKPAQADPAAPLLRALQDLKNTSLLLGADQPGELADKLAEVLQRLDEQRVPYAEAHKLFGQAVEALPALRRAFSEKGESSAALQMLTDAAERLVVGEIDPEHGQAGTAARPMPSGLAAADTAQLDGEAAVNRLADESAARGGEDFAEAAGGEAPGLAALSDDPLASTPAALPAVDEVLLDILRSEVAQHLGTIRSAMRGQPREATRVGDDLLRAVHTLHGVVAMVDIVPLMPLLSLLESWLRQLRGAGRTLSPEAGKLVGDAADAVEQTVAQLGVEQPRLPPIDDLMARLNRWTDARNHPGPPPPGRENLRPPGEPSPLGNAAAASEKTGVASAQDSVTVAEGQAPAPGRGPDNPSGPGQVSSGGLPSDQAAGVGDSASAPAGGTPLALVDPDLLETFLEEARDILDHADGELAAWRAEPAERAHMVSLQRDLHTLKGGARIVGLAPIGDLSHAMETVLDRLANHALAPGHEPIAALESGFDELYALRRRIVHAQPIEPATATIARLLALAGDGAGALGDRLSTPVAQAGEASSAEVSTRLPAAPPGAEELPASPEHVRMRADLVDDLVDLAGEAAIYQSRLDQQIGGYRVNLAELEQTVSRLRAQLRALEIETEAQIIARHQREHGDAGTASFDPLELDRYSQLQQYSRALAESVSDLVSLQGALSELTRRAEDLLVQQSRLGSRFRESLRHTRMLPFDTLMPNLRRTLRQAASDLGKQARLQVDGAHGEMDRHLLDQLKAPFEHMLRNAVAHGIETPTERLAAGKPAEGEVRIQVARESTEVVIQVADDGRGLDRAAIRRRAVEQGLLPQDEPVADAQWLPLITQPGFSTAGELTQLAGRGLGMDVVANQISRLGGSLSVESVPGRGTTFIMRLPFTLEVVQAMVVRLGESRFAIPMTSVRGVAWMGAADLAEPRVASAAHIQQGGQSYAVVGLTELLGLPPVRAAGKVPHLLVHSGELRAAIGVDELMGSWEIVVKPVGPQISLVPGILGATIMGDGTVLVILDLPSLVRHGESGRRPSTAAAIATAEARSSDPGRGSRRLLMVVDDSITMRKVTGRVLERNGFDVITARDGIEALEKLAATVPDLILLDIEMPRMDGYQLAGHLRSDERWAAVPVIMITSRSGEKHRLRALDLGIRDYLGKPYQESELIALIDRLLGLPPRETSYD